MWLFVAWPPGVLHSTKSKSLKLNPVRLIAKTEPSVAEGAACAKKPEVLEAKRTGLSSFSCKTFRAPLYRLGSSVSTPHKISFFTHGPRTVLCM